MNIHLTSGIIAFLCWSTFSTWYYVNFIKDWEQPPPEQIELAVNQAPDRNETTIDSVGVEPAEESEPEVPPIELNETFLFKKNSTELRDPEQIADFLRTVPEDLENRDINVTIVGHTCDLGTQSHNEELGLERARFIKDRLNAILPKETEVKSMGEKDPKEPNKDESSRQKNRRVNIQIITRS